MSNTNAPILPGAILADAIIAELQQVLIANIGWLDAAFGRSQRLTKKINGKQIITPNVFCGGWNGHGDNDYIEVSPDSKIGNFAFFEVADPEIVKWENRRIMDITTPFALIFWFDTRRVYGVADNRNLGTIKNDILTLLNGRTGLRLYSGGHIEINRIYERAENVYRGYTLSEIDNQYLMHPFAGLRFEGLLTIAQPCDDVGHAVNLFNTSDATIGPADVALGKIAYGSNGRVVGTNPAFIDGWGDEIINGELWTIYTTPKINIDGGTSFRINCGFSVSEMLVQDLGKVSLFNGDDFVADRPIFAGDGVLNMTINQETQPVTSIRVKCNARNLANVYVYDKIAQKYLFRGDDLYN